MEEVELPRELVGRVISFVRLAANSLLIYVECEPGDDSGYVIWLEPTWHARGPDAVLAGSRQAQVDEDCAEDQGAVLNAVARALDPLVGRKVESVRSEPITRDLVVGVEGGYEVRTFVSDPTDDHTWHIADNALRLSIYGAPRGLSVHTSAPN